MEVVGTKSRPGIAESRSDKATEELNERITKSNKRCDGEMFE